MCHTVVESLFFSSFYLFDLKTFFNELQQCFPEEMPTRLENSLLKDQNYLNDIKRYQSKYYLGLGFISFLILCEWYTSKLHFFCRCSHLKNNGTDFASNFLSLMYSFEKCMLIRLAIDYDLLMTSLLFKKNSKFIEALLCY